MLQDWEALPVWLIRMYLASVGSIAIVLRQPHPNPSATEVQFSASREIWGCARHSNAHCSHPLSMGHHEKRGAAPREWLPDTGCDTSYRVDRSNSPEGGMPIRGSAGRQQSRIDGFGRATLVAARLHTCAERLVIPKNF